MSHDCDKVAVEIQFVFINSHKQGGAIIQKSWVTEAVCYLLFKRAVLSVCYSTSICADVSACVFHALDPTHKIMKSVRSISDDHFPSIV